ncbi:MAG: ATP-binding protein [Bacillota bacterium]
MKIVYLTGVAGSGKSSLCNYIKSVNPQIEVVSYSSILKEFLEAKSKCNISQEEMRTKSASVITPEDINAVDTLLLDIINNLKKTNHVIVDSHAVTYEQYGFRTTPFKTSILNELNFELLISLYCSTNSIIKRISANPQGRPMLGPEEISYAINLQNSLVLNYGIILNKPVYFLNTDKDLLYISEWINKKLS